MAESTLTFKLPEEKERLLIAVRSYEYKSCLSELDNFLKNKIKFSELTSEQELAYQEVQDFLHKNLGGLPL